MRVHFSVPPVGLENGSSSRTSNIEIMGKKRTNKRKRVRNRPIEPYRTALSQIVAEKLYHMDGTKSRCRLVTMIMYRSIHMPNSTTQASPKSRFGLMRFTLHHSACGITTLHAITAQ